MRVDDDPGRADLVAIDDQPDRDELELHSAMSHAIRPSLAETLTPPVPFRIHRWLHQLCARGKIPLLFKVGSQPAG